MNEGRGGKKREYERLKGRGGALQKTSSYEDKGLTSPLRAGKKSREKDRKTETKKGNNDREQNEIR